MAHLKVILGNTHHLSLNKSKLQLKYEKETRFRNVPFIPGLR